MKAKRVSDAFASELRVVWDPLVEGEAPCVGDVVKLAVRLEKRLREGEKASWERVQCKASLALLRVPFSYAGLVLHTYLRTVLDQHASPRTYI